MAGNSTANGGTLAARGRVIATNNALQFRKFTNQTSNKSALATAQPPLFQGLPRQNEQSRWPKPLCERLIVQVPVLCKAHWIVLEDKTLVSCLILLQKTPHRQDELAKLSDYQPQ